METSNTTTQPKPCKKGKQGFASMDKEKARLIHAMGGRASHGGGRKKPTQDSTETTLAAQRG